MGLRFPHVVFLGVSLAAVACAAPGEGDAGSGSAAATADTADCDARLAAVAATANSTDACIEGEDEYPRDMAAYRKLAAAAMVCPTQAKDLAATRMRASTVYGVRWLAGDATDFAGVAFYANPGAPTADEPFGTLVMNLEADGKVDITYAVSGPDPSVSGTYSVLSDASGTFVTIFAQPLTVNGGTERDAFDVSGTFRLVATTTSEGYLDFRLVKEGGLSFGTFWHSGCRGI